MVGTKVPNKTSNNQRWGVGDGDGGRGCGCDSGVKRPYSPEA
jgi:hypothetical protein